VSSGRKPTKPPTILDVARLAGVSKSTVSNVIRGVDGVTAARRSRVEAAVEALGYRPNVLARQLVQQRTTILGVIVGDLANPFYAEMAKLVERHAAARGFTAMFCNTLGDVGAERSGLETFLQHRVAGIIFLAYSGQRSSVPAGLGSEVPVVFVGCSGDLGDTVTVDEERGAELGTRHLVALGHRRIAYLTTPAVEPPADAGRQAGFARAMAAAGLEKGPVLEWEPPSGSVTAGGRRVPLRAVLGGVPPLTAVFCSNDLAAIDLMDYADSAGVRVPEELSVMGFDNVMMAGLSRIALTTIAQPLDALARCGVEVLAGRIGGSVAGGPVRQVVGVRLVRRRSTGPPPPL
jgi:LacI family transcriptional regulator